MVRGALCDCRLWLTWCCPPVLSLIVCVLKNASNLASIRYDLNPEDLYIAQAFVNRGHIQKGIMIHGRGETAQASAGEERRAMESVLMVSLRVCVCVCVVGVQVGTG